MVAYFKTFVSCMSTSRTYNLQLSLRYILNAVSCFDYIALNGLMFSESCIRKDMERSGCDLIWGTILAFVWVAKENYWKPLRMAGLQARIWVTCLVNMKKEYYQLKCSYLMHIILFSFYLFFFLPFYVLHYSDMFYYICIYIYDSHTIKVQTNMNLSASARVIN